MIIQWSDEDGSFIVTLPEFDNAKTHGSTYNEAVKNGEEAIDALIETFKSRNLPLPKPMPIAV
jgi:predicted RNase H-like HicB family nuclease